MTTTPQALVRRLWWFTLSRGLVTLGLGLAALFWPALTISALFVMFGFFSLLDGMIALGTGIVFRGTAWGWTVFQGITGIIIGALALRYPQTLAAVVVIFFAFWALAIGLFQVATAVRLRGLGESSWGWLLSSGVLTSLLGLYFLVNPDSGATFLVVTVGVFAVIAGAVLIYGAFQVRRAETDLTALIGG